MTTFAKLDDDNVVLEVIVIEREEINTWRWGNPMRFVETSPDAEDYPGPGWVYDPVEQRFKPPLNDG